MVTQPIYISLRLAICNIKEGPSFCVEIITSLIYLSNIYKRSTITTIAIAYTLPTDPPSNQKIHK
jgi:hypothetical protein